MKSGGKHAFDRSGVSREDAKAQREKDLEYLAATVVDCAFNLHQGLGPGLLESVYEALLASMLCERGIAVKRQKSVPILFKGVSLKEGFRIDLLVDDKLIIEIKSVETLHPVHYKQLLTYLRLMNFPLGLLVNFGAPTIKEGLKRVVNKYRR